MPTYDYECQSCGHRFEKFQSMTANVLRKCPECKKPKLQRLIGTGAGILFKGSGFYETDYRSSSYKADEKAASESGKSDSGKSDSGKSAGSDSKSDNGDTSSSKKSTKSKKKKSDG